MRAKTVVIVLLCALIAALAACQLTPEDRDLVRSFIEEWVRAKNMHPVNKDGSLNPESIWNVGSRLVTGSSGDAEADALLDAYEVVSNLNEADKLMDKGRQERDPAAMEQAIKRRPGDWTYRVSRAALALEQGDWETYEQQKGAGMAIADQRNVDPLWYSNQNIHDLKVVGDKLAAEGWPDRRQCAAVNTELALHYEERFKITGSQADAAAAGAAHKMLVACIE